MAPRHTRRENGAVFAEFALVLPFFLFFVFGIISYGVMFSFRQTMSQAAVEGARAAAVAPSNINTPARQALAIGAIEQAFKGGIGGDVVCGGALTCTPTPVTCGTAKCISVTLTYAYRANPMVTVPLFLGMTLPETLTYTASSRIS